MQELRPRLPAFAWYYDDNPRSEDCLTLNVTTPACNGGRRPVMVWIHGGGMAAGSANAPGFDPLSLAVVENVVVVGINHRLNIFGFFCPGPEAGDDLADAANAGLLDLAAALVWVRDEITVFGGDPGRVTIFGESGGGGKVGRLLAMPQAKGLFHRAVIQSSALRQGSPGAAMAAAEHLLAQFDLTPATASRLRDVPADRLLDARLATVRAMGVDRFQPVTDGRVLFDAPFHDTAPATADAIPLLIGTCQHEAMYKLFGQPGIETMTRDAALERLARLSGIRGDAALGLWQAYADLRPGASPFAIYRDILTDQRYRLNTLMVADRKAAQTAPVFLYRFTWESPVPGLGAPHTGELPFLFGTLDATRAMVGNGPDLAQVQSVVQSAWAAFARTGNPGNDRLPPWQPYDPARCTTMLLSDRPQAIADPPGADIAVLRQFRLTGVHSTEM